MLTGKDYVNAFLEFYQNLLYFLAFALFLRASARFRFSFTEGFS
jgi:hypothetical protein